MGRTGIKIYRAIRRLDRLGDDECESLVRRVRANYSRPAELLPWTTAALAFVGSLGFLVWMSRSILAQPNFLANDRALLVTVLIALASFVLSLIVRYLIDQTILYVMLKRELKRTDCPGCGQSLMGLRTEVRGDVPDPANVFVRCPECGRKHQLLYLRLSPRDLLDPQVTDAPVGSRKGGVAGEPM